MASRQTAPTPRHDRGCPAGAARAGTGRAWLRPPSCGCRRRCLWRTPWWRVWPSSEGVRILFIKGPTAVAARRPTAPPVDRRRRAVRARWSGEARCSLGALRLATTGARELQPPFVHAARVPLRALRPLHPRRVAVRPRHPLQLPGLLRPRRCGVRGVVASAPQYPSGPLAGTQCRLPWPGLDRGSACFARSGQGFVPGRPCPPANPLRSGASDGSRARFAELAQKTGSTDTLAPLLSAIGAPEVTGLWTNPEQSRRWTVRSGNSDVPGANWLIELAATPWRNKPVLFVRALWAPAARPGKSQLTFGQNLRHQVPRWVRASRGSLRTACGYALPSESTVTGHAATRESCAKSRLGRRWPQDRRPQPRAPRSGATYCPPRICRSNVAILGDFN